MSDKLTWPEKKIGVEDKRDTTECAAIIELNQGYADGFNAATDQANACRDSITEDEIGELLWKIKNHRGEFPSDVKIAAAIVKHLKKRLS